MRFSDPHDVPKYYYINYIIFPRAKSIDLHTLEPLRRTELKIWLLLEVYLNLLDMIQLEHRRTNSCRTS